MIPSFWKIAFVVSIIRKNSNTIKMHNYLQSLNTKKTTTFPNGNTSHLKGYLQENQKLSRRNEPLSRNESGRFGAVKSNSTHHFFGNACTKSGSLRFSQSSGCWLILSVYILMSFDFPFGRLFGARSFCYYPYQGRYMN